MALAINLDNLRAITDGDTALEAELLRIFLDSAQERMAALRTACAARDDAAWKKEAHAFKGICLNLGAEPLSAVCKKAQDDPAMPADAKEKMLATMETELGAVQQIIKDILKDSV